MAHLCNGDAEDIALPWPGHLTSRADIRTYVVEMYNRASRGENPK